MSNRSNASFLTHFLNNLDNRTQMKIGPEFLMSEIKDLFYQGYYEYLKTVSSPVAEQILNQLGITAKTGYKIYKENESFHLEIITPIKKYCLKYIENNFIDDKGVFNAKGYYDEEGINQFNQHLFASFDLILDEQGFIH